MSTVNEYVIQINAEQATKNTKSLKSQIKELKEQLYQLEEGTDEYNRVMDELSQKQFKVKEIQEQTTLATKDFGQYMTNGIKTISGGIGAIQSFTSAMSLLGVEIDDSNVLVEKLVASMALLQGLSALDDGIKAFTSLTKAIKTSTVATKALSTALNFLKAHPVLAILSAVTAVGGVVWGIVEGMKSSNDEVKKLTKTLQDTQFEGLTEKLNGDSFETKKLQTSGASEQEILNQKQKEFNEIQKEANKLLELQKSLIKYSKDEDKAKMQEQIDSMEKLLKKKKEELNQEQELIKIKDEKAKAEESKQKAIERQIQLEEEARAKQEEWQSKLATAEDKNRANLEYEYLTGVITEIEYKERLLEIEETEIQNLTKKYELEGRNYHETKEYHDKRIQQIKDEIELENLRLTKEKERLENEFEGKQNNLDLSKQKTSLGVETEYLSKLSEVDFSKNIAEQVISIEQWKQEELYRIQKEGIEKQIALLQEKKDKGLISEYEFASEFVRLSAEQTELEKQQVQKRIELKENEVEANKALQDLVKQNQLELTQSVGSILGGLADSLGEETESYKWLKSAEATIDTLSAAVGVFAGISKDTNGWGLALAIAKATNVLLVGMNTVRKIQAVNVKGKNSSNYTMTNSASNALNKNYTNTRLTDGSGAEINLGDSIGKSLQAVKVYVSAGEISDVQNGMKRVQVSNQF